MFVIGIAGSFFAIAGLSMLPILTTAMLQVRGPTTVTMTSATGDGPSGRSIEQAPASADIR